MRWTWFLLAWPVAVLLFACADIQNSPKQSAGTVVGAGLGALAGAQIGSGSGQLAATAIGTLLGAWAGSEVGKSLDRADRLAASQATHNALEYTPTGAATTWRNPDTSHAGSVTPLRTYQAGGRDCRDFEQALFIDGEAETVRSTACRQPDGTGVCRDETRDPGARREEPVLALCPRLIMFPMQVPAHPLSPRSAFLALLLAATPLIPTSGSVTANAAKLALGEQVSDTLQLGQSGVAIVLPEGDWRVSGLVRPRQIGAPYALAVLTRSEGQALAGTVWVRAVGEARFATPAMWCSDGGVRLHVEPIVGASGRGCWWVRSWTTALAPADLQLYWRQAFSRLRREGTHLPRR